MTRTLHPRSTRRGITLVECVIAAAILAVVTVAGLRASGAAAVTDAKSAQRATASQLADSLLSEILSRPYSEPIATEPDDDDDGGLIVLDLELIPRVIDLGDAPLGIEAGETAGNKTTFDDIDDFNGYSESPPKDAAGNTLAAFNGWTRAVTVSRAAHAAPLTSPSTDTGVRRITITISRAGQVVLTRTSLVSDAP
ncbi:MAG: prepilin-type N-terminal cleavage/methylation domain-containing protein [Phycisphaerae bacterium]|nr:prepilin-type N-terminal cleavage/methylation domain-containing protein [Phycisphaerae bacterium]